MCGPPDLETSLYFWVVGVATPCGVPFCAWVLEERDKIGCVYLLLTFLAKFLFITNSSSSHQRHTKGTKEPASLWTCHFFVQPRFLSWLDIPQAMPILSCGPNGMTPSLLGIFLRKASKPSRPHWTSLLSPVFNGDSFFAFSTAMTRGIRYIFLGPRRLCLSRPYLMWISRVLSGETDLWLSPWQAVQKGNDLKSILARHLNISICQKMSNLL